MSIIYDMHSHLDFAVSYPHVAADANALGINTICCSVTPSAFDHAAASLSQSPNVHMSLGLHPWWIANEGVCAQEMALFRRRMDETRFIGEIGLDLGERNKGSKDLQRAVFEEIVKLIEKAGGGFFITIHAVKSADIVLDILVQHGIFDNNIVLFHWFSGTADQFKRALLEGSFFSVGPKMLNTKSGRRYAEAIPDERLLLESDSPAKAGDAFTAIEWADILQHTMDLIASIRKADQNATALLLRENSERLLRRTSA